MAKSKRFSWQAAIASIWLVFSVALAAWWLVFGLSQIERIAELAGGAGSDVGREIARRHRMLMSEGATLILLLMGGGVALLYHIRRETLRARRLKEFFAAFTHDLKTSLASLRLQAESLDEDLRGKVDDKILRRLVKDTVRLELQLENSLLLSSPDDAKFFSEPIHLKEIFEPLKFHWPELSVETQGDAVIEGDHRALESILKNLLQNSVVHGKATRVTIAVATQGERASIRIGDNGKGFKGDLNRLGEMFERHGPTSGSGLGLHLARSLARRMNGELKLTQVAEGFGAEITLPIAREVKA